MVYLTVFVCIVFVIGGAVVALAGRPALGIGSALGGSSGLFVLCTTLKAVADRFQKNDDPGLVEYIIDSGWLLLTLFVLILACIGLLLMVDTDTR